MTPSEIKELAREIYEAGTWRIDRAPAHTPEWAKQTEDLLNRIYRHFGRSCRVSLNRLWVTVQMD